MGTTWVKVDFKISMTIFLSMMQIRFFKVFLQILEEEEVLEVDFLMTMNKISFLVSVVSVAKDNNNNNKILIIDNNKEIMILLMLLEVDLVVDLAVDLVVDSVADLIMIFSVDLVDLPLLRWAFPALEEEGEVWASPLHRVQKLWMENKLLLRKQWYRIQMGLRKLRKKLLRVIIEPKNII